MRPNLGIAMRGEAMSLRPQFGDEFRVLKEFAVEGHPYVLPLIAQGLPAALHIDDRQFSPPPGRRRLPRAVFVIRPAMRQHATHCLKTFGREGPHPGQVHRPGDSTHDILRSRSPSVSEGVVSLAYAAGFDQPISMRHLTSRNSDNR